MSVGKCHKIAWFLQWEPPITSDFHISASVEADRQPAELVSKLNGLKTGLQHGTFHQVGVFSVLFWQRPPKAFLFPGFP